MVDIGERDGAVLTTNVLEILPAGVGREVGNDTTELAAADTRFTARRRGSTIAGRGSIPAIAAAATTVESVRTVAGRLTTTLTALCVLDYDSLAHEVLAVEILDGIFGITRVLELDKTERAHNADIVQALCS